MPVQGWREKNVYRREDDLWNHVSGHACFQLDAAIMTPYPQQ